MNVQVLGLGSGRAGSWVLSRVWKRVQSDDCVDLAAQMSFYFALSLLPFFLILAAVVGWLPSTILWRSFVTWMVTYLPRQSREIIFSTILGLVNYSRGFLSLGLATALWSASAGFVSMMESLSVVYGTRDNRSYVRKHLIAVGITILTSIFALTTFGLMVFGRWGLDLIPAHLRSWRGSWALWDSVRWIVTAVLMCLGVDLLNFLLPVIKRPWRWLSPGTAFVVITLVASSEGLNVYVQHFSSYPRIYGTLGGFIVLLLWIYIASLILLIGAEMDRAIEQLRGAGAE